MELIAVLLIFGVVALWRGLRRFRIKQWIEDLPTSRISTAAQGLIEVQGRALAVQNQIYSTYFKEQAVYIRMELQQWMSGRNSGWKTINFVTHGNRLMVEDPTGLALIDLKGAEFILKQESFEFTQGNSLDGMKLPFDWTLDKSKKYKIIEQKITIGEPVFVIGEFRTSRNEPELEVQDGKSNGRKVRSRGTIGKSSSHPFIVSDSHQADLLKKVSLGVPIMIVGAAMISAAAYLFLKRGT